MHVERPWAGGTVQGCVRISFYLLVECKKKVILAATHDFCHIAELCLLEKFRGLKFKIKFTSDVLIKMSAT